MPNSLQCSFNRDIYLIEREEPGSDDVELAAGHSALMVLQRPSQDLHAASLNFIFSPAYTLYGCHIGEGYRKTTRPAADPYLQTLRQREGEREKRGGGGGGEAAYHRIYCHLLFGM